VGGGDGDRIRTRRSSVRRDSASGGTMEFFWYLFYAGSNEKKGDYDLNAKRGTLHEFNFTYNNGKITAFTIIDDDNPSRRAQWPSSNQESMGGITEDDVVRMGYTEYASGQGLIKALIYNLDDKEFRKLYPRNYDTDEDFPANTTIQKKDIKIYSVRNKDGTGNAAMNEIDKFFSKLGWIVPPK
jgi:hypothetical protein